MPPFDRDRVMAAMDAVFRSRIPYSAALGIEVIDCAPATATFRLPYRDELVGDPARGILHGGAISVLMDTCCGAAVNLALAQLVNIATLDLRIDYLKPATPRRDVFGRAECYKTTRNIAFVRATAYHDESDPIAAASASFMLATQGDPIVGGGGA